MPVISTIESRFWCTQKQPLLTCPQWSRWEPCFDNQLVHRQCQHGDQCLLMADGLPHFRERYFFLLFFRFKPEFYLMVQKCWNRKEKHERDNKELFPTQSLNLMRLNYAISSESLFVRIFCSNMSRFLVFLIKKTTSFLSSDISCGPYEKMLLKHLLYDYERQNRFIVHETSLCEDSEDYFVDFIHNSFFA